ncbi:MAG: hydroxymethylglutaryl-CoA synthase family protein [Candidatus Rokubacteria bacterium]|nr:hydroxymethylglutaryl-CoA synthase family protein [Candidatus Rokubacteria bacterium]MBI3824928.1 hydroxymethylglutaryl-CoA synthase family protein [Candidatus Rokubacteria bacterium]
MNGILSYAAYVPFWRLDRKAIGDALGASAGKGTRAVASHDEDTTSMGVEAGRAALRGVTTGPEALYFATAVPGYLDKTNATAIHAALALPGSAMAVDMVGSIRSGVGALRAALDAPRPTLAVLSDVRTGLPGGGDERDGGDAAVAFLCGPGDAGVPVLAEPVAWASATAEFLERWRVPGEPASRQWEERFGEHAYVPLAQAAITEGLTRAGVAPGGLHRVIVAGPHGRANKRVAGGLGAKPDAIADDLAGSTGNTGTAHAGLMLADALDTAAPDQLILVVSLADGCDVTIWKTTAALASRRAAKPVSSQLAGGGKVSYATFLTWRGFLDREPPRRPDPEPPAAPPSFRAEDWKFGFTGSRCEACGARHLPPQRVCVKCHAIDRMKPERLADVPATIATFTVDRLAYSLSPPVVAAVIDFEGGGRYQCELTDVDPAAVQIGDRVEMTFRRLYTANGVHNYFWKARPIR